MFCGLADIHCSGRNVLISFWKTVASQLGSSGRPDPGDLNSPAGCNDLAEPKSRNEIFVYTSRNTTYPFLQLGLSCGRIPRLELLAPPCYSVELDSNGATTEHSKCTKANRVLMGSAEHHTQFIPKTPRGLWLLNQYVAVAFMSL